MPSIPYILYYTLLYGKEIPDGTRIAYIANGRIFVRPWARLCRVSPENVWPSGSGIENRATGETASEGLLIHAPPPARIAATRLVAAIGSHRVLLECALSGT